jgi:hypothetical protein
MEIKIIIDDRIVNLLRRTRTVVTTKRLACAAAAATLGLALFAGASPVTPPHVFQPGTRITASEVNEAFGAIFAAFNDRIIRDDRTIAVAASEGCAGLVAALEALDEKRIASTATVTIRLSPGTYACEGAVDIRHPSGHQLHIVGGGNSPSDVELTFPAGSNGMFVADQALGLLANMTITGAGASDSNGTGVRAVAARMRVEDVIVQAFNIGIQADTARVTGTNILARNNIRGARAVAGGHLDLNDSTAASNTGVGFACLQGSTLRLRNPQSLNNGTAGYSAEDGGSLYASGSTTAHGNAGDGFVSVRGAVIRLDAGATSTNNAVGFRAGEGGQLRTSGAVASNNTSHGFVAFDGSTLFAISSPTATSNGGNGFRVGSSGWIRITGTPVTSGNVAGDYNTTPVGSADSGHLIVSY